MRNQHIGLPLALILTQAACGGGGGGDAHPFGSAYCDAIGGAVAVTIDPACPTCAVSDPDNSADGALGSYATLSLNPYASGTGISIRATSVEYPAGSIAAAFIRLPQGAQAWAATLRTLLDGVEQESIPYSSPTLGTPEDVYGTFAFEAGQPFDAIEVQVTSTRSDGMAFDFRVYEFCSDIGSR